MNSVPVLPKGRFWEMISFEFHLENRREKTREPLWLPGFQPRYLFRCCLLVAGVGLEPHDLRVMSFTTIKTKKICGKKCSKNGTFSTVIISTYLFFMRFHRNFKEKCRNKV